MALETTKWDIQDHLNTPEEIGALLEAVFEDGDPVLIGAALGDIARAKGIPQNAREALCQGLIADGEPKLSTLLALLKALDLKLTIEPATTGCAGPLLAR